MPEFQRIKFREEEGRAQLILNNPSHNLLNTSMLEEILYALEPLRDNDAIKVLLIRGVGGVFCSGIATEDLMSDRIGALMPLYTRMFDYINGVHGLVVAAVEGEAIGPGLELAAFCDVTIGAETAKFAFPEIAMGLFPPIATAILPRLIGRNRALDWLVSGRTFSAHEAVEGHLLARTVPDDEMDAFIEDYVGRIASFSAQAIRLAKRAVDSALYIPVMEALKSTESTYMLDLMNSIDAQEGLRAKIENRSPVWRNR